ncbi:hypothetical protein, partial [Helicobacter sp. CLO-3]
FIKNIFDIVKLLGHFARLWEIGKIYRLTNLARKIKAKADIISSAKDNSTKVDSAMEALDLVLEYRRENPKDFEDIFAALENISQDYKKDPQKRQAIKDLLGKID